MLSEVEARALAPRRSGGGSGVRRGYGVWEQRYVLPSWRHPRREASGDPSLNRAAGGVMERCAHEAPAGDGPPDGVAIGGDEERECGKIQPGACAWACSGQSQCDC